MRLLNTLPVLGATLLLAPFANAATLCVSANGAAGCFTHIADAVRPPQNAGDIIKVGKRKPIQKSVVHHQAPFSLVGDTAIIDATGRMQGQSASTVWAAPRPLRRPTSKDSPSRTPTSRASSPSTPPTSTIAKQTSSPTNNNLALVNGQTAPCSLPTSLARPRDCGEGIHIQGTDPLHRHQQQHRPGKTPAAIPRLRRHRYRPTTNLISFKHRPPINPFACGINLTSHVRRCQHRRPRFPLRRLPQTPSYGNRSMRQRKPRSAGGAGIGVLSPRSPPPKTYGKRRPSTNYVSQKRPIPAISMHAPRAPSRPSPTT